MDFRCVRDVRCLYVTATEYNNDASALPCEISDNTWPTFIIWEAPSVKMKKLHTDRLGSGVGGRRCSEKVWLASIWFVLFLSDRMIELLRAEYDYNKPVRLR